MKTLIVLKGLSKIAKNDWVEYNGLSDFYIDINVIEKLYSIPEVSNDSYILNKNFCSEVHKNFVTVVLSRLNKGSLVVVDLNNLSTSTVELLGTFFGYTIFYKVFDIPHNYLHNYEYFVNSGYGKPSKDEIRSEVDKFLLQDFKDKLLIDSYKDIVKYWNKKEKVINLNINDDVLFVSDLHSHYEIYKTIPFDDYSLVITLGDYIDGPIKYGSRKLIGSILNNPKNNCIYLEGNHELRLRKYLAWKYFSFKDKKVISGLLEEGLSKEFMINTSEEFNDINSNEIINIINNLNSRLLTHVVLVDKDKKIFCTHAGVKYLSQLDPRFIGSVINGSRDMNYYDKTFSVKYKENNLISVHAHCKYSSDKWIYNKFKNVYNIDPESEFDVVMLAYKKWKLFKFSENEEKKIIRD